MSLVPRGLIALIVIGVMFAVIWPKVRIHIFIPISGGQALMTLGVVALVLFLAVDHLINRTR